MTNWKDFSAEVNSNLRKKDLNALNVNVVELINNLNNFPKNEAWFLVKKIYNEYKNDYRINNSLGMLIPVNYQNLPNKEEAWVIFEEIPYNVEHIFENNIKIWLISQLQYRSDTLPAGKIWNILEGFSNDKNPEVRGEAGYTICEYIAQCEDFPKYKAWNKIKILIKDPKKNVKERILTAFSSFYSDLPKTEIWDLTLILSKQKSKKIKDGCLNVAIEKSKDLVKTNDYLNASKNLEYMLNELRRCSRFAWIRISYMVILLIIGIYLVKDTWIYLFNTMPYVFVGIGLLLLLIWKFLKLKLEKYMIFLYTILFIIPIFFLFPLPYVFLSYIFHINLNIITVVFLGIIPTFLFIIYIFGHIGLTIKLMNKNMRYSLAEGLSNYYIGRYYIRMYIDSENSKIKLNYLNKAIKKFSISNNCYNRLLFGFKDELSLCPYCLNFYQGINCYEELLRAPNPKKSDIDDLEKKINKSTAIMNETNKGSDRLNLLLNELFKATNILFELQKKRQKISDSDSIDRMRTDNEIKKKSNDIDKIIQKIDNIISDVEDQNLSLIIEIMKEKRTELDNISLNIKKEGFNGFNKYYAGEKYNLAQIILFIIGIIFISVSVLYSSTTNLLIGISGILGSIIMSLAKFKRQT